MTLEIFPNLSDPVLWFTAPQTAELQLLTEREEQTTPWRSERCSKWETAIKASRAGPNPKLKGWPEPPAVRRSPLHSTAVRHPLAEQHRQRGSGRGNIKASTSAHSAQSHCQQPCHPKSHPVLTARTQTNIWTSANDFLEWTKGLPCQGRSSWADSLLNLFLTSQYEQQCS